MTYVKKVFIDLQNVYLSLNLRTLTNFNVYVEI